MSDRRPNVKVQQTFDSRWIATCEEPNCTWQHAPDVTKAYIEERARAHRRKHRKAAASGE